MARAEARAHQDHDRRTPGARRRESYEPLNSPTARAERLWRNTQRRHRRTRQSRERGDRGLDGTSRLTVVLHFVFASEILAPPASTIIVSCPLRHECGRGDSSRSPFSCELTREASPQVAAAQPDKIAAWDTAWRGDDVVDHPPKHCSCSWVAA